MHGKRDPSAPPARQEHAFSQQLRITGRARSDGDAHGDFPGSPAARRDELATCAQAIITGRPPRCSAAGMRAGSAATLAQRADDPVIVRIIGGNSRGADVQGCKGRLRLPRAWSAAPAAPPHAKPLPRDARSASSVMGSNIGPVRYPLDRAHADDREPSPYLKRRRPTRRGSELRPATARPRPRPSERRCVLTVEERTGASGRSTDVRKARGSSGPADADASVVPAAAGRAGAPGTVPVRTNCRRKRRERMDGGVADCEHRQKGMGGDTSARLPP